MGVARMVGHVTYLSAQSIGDKFGRRLQFADDVRYTVTEPEFEVESYLRHQGESFVKRFDANTYLYTSRALTYFDLARQYGKGSLAEALRPVRARTLLIAFSSDWLYPPIGSEEIAAALRCARQGRGAACDRRALRPRLLPAGRGAPDADDPVVSCTPANLKRGSEEADFDGPSATERGAFSPVRIRHAAGARRPAPRPQYRRARRADLPDHELRVRGSGIGRRLFQPAGVRQHLLAHHEPHRGRVRGAHGQPRRRQRRRGLRQRHRGAGGGALHAAAAGGPRGVVVGALRRHGQPVQAPAAQDERGAHVGRSRRSRGVARRHSATTPSCSTPRRSAIPPATCSTSRRSPRIAHEHACR